MDRTKCPDYLRLAQTIELNNEAATAVGRAIEETPNQIASEKTALRDALLAYKEANVVLNRWLDAHKRQCPECLKGD
jgi:hypothetical protein